MNHKFGVLNLKCPATVTALCFLSLKEEKSVSTRCIELARDERFVTNEYFCVSIKWIQSPVRPSNWQCRNYSILSNICVCFYRVTYGIVINTFILKYDLFRQKFVDFARFHYVMPLNYAIWEFRWKSTRSVYAVFLNFIFLLSRSFLCPFFYTSLSSFCSLISLIKQWINFTAVPYR